MRAQNRHDTQRWKKRRKDHLSDKCSVSKCPICHPHKFIGGNHKGREKSKYYNMKRAASRPETALIALTY